MYRRHFILFQSLIVCLMIFKLCQSSSNGCDVTNDGILHSPLIQNSEDDHNIMPSKLSDDSCPQNNKESHRKLKPGSSEEFKGHLQPFGESGSKRPIQEMKGFPIDHGRNFFLDYVIPSLPVLMKGAATRSPSFQKWADDSYLSRVSSLEQNRNLVVGVEVGKKEERGAGVRGMRFHEFLRDYNTSDWYMVQDCLPWMETLSLMPCPLQCPHLANVSMNSVLWFSSGGTKSVVHTDSVENINCLYRGNKTLVMLDPAGISTGTIIDRFDGGFSSMDVDRVDLNRYPTLRGAQFVTAAMEPGDCLYIPKKWIHQVRSHGSNLAINVWFHGSETRELLKKGYCTGNDLVCDPTFTLGRVTHPKFQEESGPDIDGDEMLRHFFEYSAVHGKAAFSPENPPLTKADLAVKVEIFIEELLKYHADFILGVFHTGYSGDDDDDDTAYEADKKFRGDGDGKRSYKDNDNGEEESDDDDGDDDKTSVYDDRRTSSTCYRHDVNNYGVNDDNCDDNDNVNDNDNDNDENSLYKNTRRYPEDDSGMHCDKGGNDESCKARSNNYTADENKNESDDNDDDEKKGHKGADNTDDNNIVDDEEGDDEYNDDDDVDDDYRRIDVKALHKLAEKMRDVIGALDKDRDGILTSYEFEDGVSKAWTGIVAVVKLMKRQL